jgi:hypothetical protein
MIPIERKLSHQSRIKKLVREKGHVTLDPITKGIFVSTSLHSIGIYVTVDAMSLIDKLDQRLPRPTKDIKNEVLSIIGIAIHCLSERPHGRPTMEQVCKEIVMSKSSSDIGKV